jgi:hypothetical protein
MFTMYWFDLIWLLLLGHNSSLPPTSVVPLTLLSKRPDTHMLSDYQPVSLIHLVSKVVAKVLSLRLAPKLDGLVIKSQNAYVRTTTSRLCANL